MHAMPKHDDRSATAEGPTPAEPSTRSRARRQVPEALRALLVAFRAEHDALVAADQPTEEALRHLIEGIIARHVAVAPEALRAELELLLRNAVAEDPMLRTLVDEMRAAAAAGR